MKGSGTEIISSRFTVDAVLQTNEYFIRPVFTLYSADQNDENISQEETEILVSGVGKL